MECKPDWLPDILCVDGDYSQVLDALYKVFQRDIAAAQLMLDGHAISWDRRRIANSAYEEGFWHLITCTDKITGDRLHDPRRAERLPWCGPTIRHNADPAVTAWEYEESNGKIRTYLWLKNFNYVLVLEKRLQKKGSPEAVLITAFHVGGEGTRKSLQKKYNTRVVTKIQSPPL